MTVHNVGTDENFRTECDICYGTGEYEPFDLDVELDKLYPTEMTNEEWIKSLNTEQLAGFIADICYELQDEIWCNSEDTSCDYHQTDEAYWVEWLKEKHN